jgi:ABC-type nitrate/sulfonate/bicarbonate transport system permease component
VARPARPRRLLTQLAAPLVGALLVLAAWELYARLSGVRESTLPAPSEVLAHLWEDRGLLAANAWPTVAEVLLGYLAAAALGVGVAVLVHGSWLVERALYPWLVVSQTVPIPAIAPVIVLWTGFDLRPRLIVIALVCFFPVAVNTIDGLKAAEPELLGLLRTLGATRRQRFWLARLPAALPFVFSGLKVAAAFSVIGAVFAEWVGSASGLGQLILVLNNQAATSEMFAVIAVLSAIGVGLFGLVSLAERLLLPWYFEARGPS